MLRADLAAARNQWLHDAIKKPDEYHRRKRSDFLCETNHAGQVFDCHGLRHTCGAWLAMTGAHPKVVQTVMRHSSITLTMDTYGHLFPGQEADAVAKLRDILAAKTQKQGGQKSIGPSPASRAV
jgi:integrase